MKRIQPDDLIFIDLLHSQHYHVQGCLLTGQHLAIQFKDLHKYKPANGGHFKKCACVDAYEQDKELKRLK